VIICCPQQLSLHVKALCSYAAAAWGRRPGWAGFPGPGLVRMAEENSRVGIRRGCRRRIRGSFRPGMPC